MWGLVGQTYPVRMALLDLGRLSKFLCSRHPMLKWHLFARDGTRTRMPHSIRPSSVRVCQFHHPSKTIKTHTLLCHRSWDYLTIPASSQQDKIFLEYRGGIVHTTNVV
jgi:hypothetical protein